MLCKAFVAMVLSATPESEWMTYRPEAACCIHLSPDLFLYSFVWLLLRQGPAVLSMTLNSLTLCLYSQVLQLQMCTAIPC